MDNVAIPRVLLRTPDRFGGARQGDLQHGQPILQNGRIARLEMPEPAAPTRMLIPSLTEAHCHLDKCHTIGRLGSIAGDLTTAISAQLRDKRHWTPDDIQTRASRGLREAMEAGCGAIRSHVDWGDGPEPPKAWHILNELAQDTKGITLQLSPLTGIDRMAETPFTHALAHAAKEAGGALGAFIQNHEHMRDGIHHMFDAALQHGLPLDFHVDEGLGDLNGLELIADIALETRFEGPILCGHAVSLIDRTPEDFSRISDKLARADITVCALPTTNLYLQDRSNGTPDRRGLTRLRELRTAGVRVLVGSDNVADAFCPLGQFDPMAALHLCALAAHLDPPMAQWLPMITTDARRAMGLPPLYVDDAPVDQLYLSDATDCEALVSGRAALKPFPVSKESRH